MVWNTITVTSMRDLFVVLICVLSDVICIFLLVGPKKMNMSSLNRYSVRATKMSSKLKQTLGQKVLVKR